MMLNRLGRLRNHKEGLVGLLQEACDRLRLKRNGPWEFQGAVGTGIQLPTPGRLGASFSGDRRCFRSLAQSPSRQWQTGVTRELVWGSLPRHVSGDHCQGRASVQEAESREGMVAEVGAVGGCRGEVVVLYKGKGITLFRLLVRMKVAQLTAIVAAAVPIATYSTEVCPPPPLPPWRRCFLLSFALYPISWDFPSTCLPYALSTFRMSLASILCVLSFAARRSALNTFHSSSCSLLCHPLICLLVQGGNEISNSPAMHRCSCPPGLMAVLSSLSSPQRTSRARDPNGILPRTHLPCLTTGSCPSGASGCSQRSAHRRGGRVHCCLVLLEPLRGEAVSPAR